MEPETPEVRVLPASDLRAARRDSSDLPFRKLALVSILFLFLGTLVSLIFLLSRERNMYMALLNPDQPFDQERDESGLLEKRKAEILRSLNEDIHNKTRGTDQDDNRLLARLDRLWSSLKRYVSQEADQKPLPERVSESESHAARERLRTWVPPPNQAGNPLDMQSEEILQNILSLSNDPKVIREVSLKNGRNPAPLRAESLDAKNSDTKSAIHTRATGSGTLEDLLYRLEPTGGLRTRGVAWRLHPKLTVEGSLDTTQVGETDTDLTDFGFRSVQALAFLRDQSSPSLMGYDNIDSGYPRSYGIGLNFRLSSSMQMLFDYSHEYPNDYFIEYRGNWESSLLADFSKKRPDNSQGDVSTHNFFFGLRYLHRMDKALIPLHTGFFYSTNMADDPLPSDVSMGFSVGGGYQKNAMQLGVSYRLRIWENPEDLLLTEMAAGDINTRVSNQLLFFMAF
jgi:hypothetical protein